MSLVRCDDMILKVEPSATAYLSTKKACLQDDTVRLTVDDSPQNLLEPVLEEDFAAVAEHALKSSICSVSLAHRDLVRIERDDRDLRQAREDFGAEVRARGPESCRRQLNRNSSRSRVFLPRGR